MDGIHRLLLGLWISRLLLLWILLLLGLRISNVEERFDTERIQPRIHHIHVLGLVMLLLGLLLSL